MPYRGSAPHLPADVGEHDHDFRVDPNGARQLDVHYDDGRDPIQSHRLICIVCGATALAPYEGLDALRRDPSDIRDWATIEEAHEELRS